MIEASKSGELDRVRSNPIVPSIFKCPVISLRDKRRPGGLICRLNTFTDLKKKIVGMQLAFTLRDITQLANLYNVF